jgi:predicted nuclease with RNAse H fold
MFYDNCVYVGVDPATGRKDFTYAALDGELKLIALTDADMDNTLAFLGGHKSAIVAINAPSQVNRGLVKKRLEESSLTPGQTFRGVDMRLVEHNLRKRGISVAGTPSREELCPAWVQVGFAFYRKLSKLGFVLYGSEDAAHQWLETHPFACFCTLLERVPFPKPTLEGRLQRQITIYDKGLHITDPMDFFEEITRFKLMQGILPTEVLYTPDQLDVLVAAYTAWLAFNRPEEVIALGDKSEGQVVLPVGELKEKY